MENKKDYSILERYRISLDEPWEVFGSRLCKEMDIPYWSVLYKAATGRTQPNARTAEKIDIWYQNHFQEVFDAASQSLAKKMSFK